MRKLRETMKIAVIGATGTVGKPLVKQLREAGHDVAELSRSTGVDLTTGEGLRDGLAGADVCVDVSMPMPAEGEDLVKASVAASERLLAAVEAEDVERVVFLSITNLDNPRVAEFEYYQAKVSQEETLRESSVPTSVVHSAQWMEFALNPAAVEETDDDVRVQDWLIQPVAAEEVARVLAEVAATPGDRVIAGPEQIRLPDLTRKVLSAKGDGRPVKVVPPALPAFGDGSLVAPEGAEVAGPTPEEWVSTF